MYRPRRIGALSRAIGSAAGGLMRLTRRLFAGLKSRRQEDYRIELRSINAAIEMMRRHHRPCKGLLEKRSALVHDRLRGGQ